MAEVVLWRIADNKVLRRMGGHTGTINSVAIAPNGDILASGSDDKTVRLWRSEDVNCIAFAPDGVRIAAGSEDKMIRLWSLR